MPDDLSNNSQPEPVPSTGDRQDATAALGDEAPAPAGGWRDRMRRNPAVRPFYRAGVFVAGLAFVVLGVVALLLPGPLTIPPVLVGLWIWSTEFEWAHRLFKEFQQKAREAWDHAKAHPVIDGIITVGGLVMAGVAFWAVAHYDLIEKGKDVIGL